MPPTTSRVENSKRTVTIRRTSVSNLWETSKSQSSNFSRFQTGSNWFKLLQKPSTKVTKDEVGTLRSEFDISQLLGTAGSEWIVSSTPAMLCCKCCELRTKRVQTSNKKTT
jgi:hypothetical protein